MSTLLSYFNGSTDLEFHPRGRVFVCRRVRCYFGFLNPPLDVRWHNEVSRHSAVAYEASMITIKWHAAGTMRLTLCIGQYALKLPRGVLGCVANYGERVEWKRATLERRAILCPLLWGAPFGLINIMRRAIPLTSEQNQAHLDNGTLPDWNYMPGEPDCPLEYPKPSNWGYFDGPEHPVALDYPAVDVFNRWDGIDAINE